MLVKICGITSLEDARLSAGLGADALGFNFCPRSPRYLPLAAAERIIARLPESLLNVAVVVLGQVPPLDEIPKGIDVIQVHGAACEDDLNPFQGRRVWVAVQGDSPAAFADREVIVDPSSGRGVPADWSALREWGRPYILAGGLTPENVGRALDQTSPIGVDVCSGVEAFPGRKDPEKLKNFIKAVGGSAGWPRRKERKR